MSFDVGHPQLVSTHLNMDKSRAKEDDSADTCPATATSKSANDAIAVEVVATSATTLASLERIADRALTQQLTTVPHLFEAGSQLQRAM
jgi:hypothetical protein